MRILVAVLLACLSGTAMAVSSEIPVNEEEFVERIKTADKSQIVEQLGEPASAIDVTDQETGEVMGSIWHYHYLNTGENGDYYKTTELDFVGDRVVTIVFSMTEDDVANSAKAEPDIIPQLECAATC